MVCWPSLFLAADPRTRNGDTNASCILYLNIKRATAGAGGTLADEGKAAAVGLPDDESEVSHSPGKQWRFRVQGSRGCILGS